MHPEVKQGKKTEQEVLAEFLDTFEIHTGTVDKTKRDGKLTLREFQDYYRKIGASIDDDRYFELMMVNAWNLDNKSYSKGFGADRKSVV